MKLTLFGIELSYFNIWGISILEADNEVNISSLFGISYDASFKEFDISLFWHNFQIYI